MAVLLYFLQSGNKVNKLLGHGASPVGNIITRLVSQKPKGASGEIAALSGLQSVQAIDTFYCK